MKVDAYRKAPGIGGPNSGESHKGLDVHARVGLHEFIASKIGTFFPHGCSVLDLGAGTGAMTARLLESGFRVTAMDIVEENFRLKGEVPFIALDLNDSFSEKCEGRFDGITAVEIIEHLENPRKFLRECRESLKDGGSLILSTPNVDNPLSKGMFLKSGTFQWFTDYNYEYDGHITPITQWMLGKIAVEAGFTITWLGSYGNPCNGKGMVIKTAAWLIRLLASYKREMTGEILVAVLKKRG